MARPVLKKSPKKAKKAGKTKIAEKTKKINAKSPPKKKSKPNVENKKMPKAKPQNAKKALAKNKTKGKEMVKKTGPKKTILVTKIKGKQTLAEKDKKSIKQKAVKKVDVKSSLNVVRHNTLLKTREANKMKSKLTQVVEQMHFHPGEYMTPEHQRHFREILLNWKKQLLGEMERTVHQMQDEVTVFADPNDRATQEEEFSIELRTRDRERKLIKKIEEALERLGRNDYGYCEDCGVEIGLKRLEARPTATLCIDCKTIEEIREKSSSE